MSSGESGAPELTGPSLEGKVAVVTGGGGGLGTALARVFARSGMGIAALDIDGEAAATAAHAISEEFGVPTTAATVDVGDAVSVSGAARHVANTLGGCDVLCANVGVQQFGAIDALTEHDWQWVLNVNILGTVRTVREFLPLMRAQSGWRRIVLTASSSVLAPALRMAAYQTSKFAIMGFGETLRAELAAEGIGVTTLFPGGMMTRHLETSAQARPAQFDTTGASDDDLTTMLSSMAMDERDLVLPDEAVRNLLADLVADEPYSVTHGSFRPVYEQRRAAMDAAFDRMERS